MSEVPPWYNRPADHWEEDYARFRASPDNPVKLMIECGYEPFDEQKQPQTLVLDQATKGGVSSTRKIHGRHLITVSWNRASEEGLRATAVALLALTDEVRWRAAHAFQGDGAPP